MIGADTQELLGLQAGMIRASGSLQQIADALMPQLATTTWHGSDRIQFETRLGEARASLTQVSEQMRAKAGELGGHAEEQDRASEPDSTSATFSMRSLRDHLRRAQELTPWMKSFASSSGLLETPHRAP